MDTLSNLRLDSLHWGVMFEHYRNVCLRSFKSENFCDATQYGWRQARKLRYTRIAHGLFNENSLEK